jgi:predicted MFS family arabinose efflux permease
MKPAEGAMSNVGVLQADVPAGLADTYTRYVIAVVWVTLVLRVVDIQIVSVLLEPIRREFQVSDTQLGLLSGFAFSVLYGVLGIPVAWLADRKNRRTIIASAVGLWSAMTAACGFASSFMWLSIARAGVGVGEAGGTAPAYSLVSDLVPARKRATAFALLSASVPTGIFVGLLVGGWANEYYGWRSAFFLLGIVGISVALLVRLTVREPPRRMPASHKAEAPIRLGEALRRLSKNRSYLHLVAASSIFTAGAMGSGMWIASFFIRVHQIPPAEAATWLALIYGGGGIAGSVLGGLLADRLVARSGDPRWYARLSAAVTIGILPFAGLVYLWGGPTQALLLHVGAVVLMHMWMGPTYGTIQNLVEPRTRATAAAVNMLVINVIAYGAGPLLVGIASDALSSRVGTDSLRYSILAVVVVTYVWAAVHFLAAGRTLRKDLENAGAA